MTSQFSGDKKPSIIEICDVQSGSTEVSLDSPRIIQAMVTSIAFEQIIEANYKDKEIK